MAQRRRAGARRGGYYALPRGRKARGVAGPLTVLGGLLAAFSAVWVGLVVLVGLATWGAYTYFAKDLPSIDDIHAIQFETTHIYDRHGNVLYEMFDPGTGRRNYVTVDQMPRSLINATIAAEDESFEKNSGVDPKGIARAMYINLTNKGSSGGSTITQQLVRRVLLPEGDEPTFTRKIREAILAVRMTQKYSKEKILEIYLNEIYYGSLSYGVDAAANTYFGRRVKDLTLAQSAMLAGLPQLPGDYDPNRNFELARARQKIVLGLMVNDGYITQQEADAAYAEDVHPVARTAHVPLKVPHFVHYVQQVLEQKYGVEQANRGGLKVFTTIDLDMQAEAQRIAAQQIENIKRQGASNAALVAINPRTGEILAMVGSVDYTNPSFGEVNVATSPRQPGSSFKPFTYAAAFQQGNWNPSSILPDFPVKFGGGRTMYVPQNYDGRFHGLVTIRSALANSFNIPAVVMLDQVGIPAVLDTSHRLGITTLNDPDRYGLALTLGGGEVTLLDMTSAYGTFANYGLHMPATPFLRVTDSKGQVLEELDPEHPAGKQVLSPGVAYQISSILSDNSARAPMFGPNSALKIDGIEAAAKTGTTNDWKDSWTMGYTPALAVGVWVGNNDGRPMAHVAGAIGAAPIWHNFIQKVYGEPKLKARLLMPGEADLPAKFHVPPGMVRMEVCAVSGMAPTEACVNRRLEWFTPENVPHDECDWHQWIPVTLHDGGATRAGPGTPPEDTIERVFAVPPSQYKGRVAGGPPLTGTLPINGTAPAPILPTPVLTEPLGIMQMITPVAGWAPGKAAEPPPNNPGPIAGLRIDILSPERMQPVKGTVTVTGHAEADDLARYKLEYGPGNGSGPMTTIADSQLAPLNGVLGMWRTDGLPPGPYTLRVTVETRSGQVAWAEMPVRVGSVAPSVTIASPADGTQVYLGEVVDIQVSADGGGAPVGGVEIYADGKRIASLLAPPWSARWVVLTGTHELGAAVYTISGEQARAAPVHVTSAGQRPTPTPSPVSILWISNLTEYKEIRAGINEVWVDVEPSSRVQHVDIYIDGFPAGYATGPGFRVNPAWTPTPAPPATQTPSPTLEPNAAATATQAQATADARATRVAKASATRAARAAATATAKAALAAATAESANATATIKAATTSPTPGPPPATLTPLPTATFVRYQRLPDPMLGDYVARCVFTPGRHRVTAIGYDANNIQVGRNETWVVVR